MQVVHDPSLSFGENDVNRDWSLLAESPAAADRLVILLEAVRRKVGNMVAVLKVQAPRSYLRFGDEHPSSAFGKVDQPRLFDLIAIGARYLDGIRDQFFKQVAFFVQMAPDEGGLAGVSHHGRNLLAPLPDGSLLLCPLFPQVSGRNSKQHSFGHAIGFDEVILLYQWWQDESSILESKV